MTSDKIDPWTVPYDFRGQEISPVAQRGARLRAMAGWIRNLADSVEESDWWGEQLVEETLKGNVRSATEWANDQWTEYL